MKKFLVVVVILAIATFICWIAPNYYLEEVYDKNEIRIIVNDREITHNDKILASKPLVIDGKLMLPQNTVDILFDKWLYFDEKYDTLISTTETDVAKLKLDDKKIQFGNEIREIEVPAQIIDDTVYIPIEELESFYDITITNNEKYVITTKKADYITVELDKKLNIYAYKKNFSRVIAKCGVGEEVKIFGFRDNPEWVLVRRNNGDLGYAKMNNISSEKMEGNVFSQLEFPTPKVNLVWEYAENYTPDRTGEKKIDVIDVVVPTWIYFKNIDGEITNRISKDYITWAHNNNYRVWATIKNERIYPERYALDTMKLEETSNIVTDMKIRENIISSLINICKEYDIDGINVDFEYMKKEDADDFSQFIRELSAMLRQNGLTASVDVNVPDGSDNWSLCYNHYQLADAVDYLVVMTYDQYGSSSTVPGSTAELSWVENNVKKLVERDGIKAQKIVIGIPLYSRIWKVENGRVTKNTINMKSAKNYLNREHEWLEDEGQYYVEFESNNASYMLWVEDENSAKEKLGLVEKYDLAGAAFWVRGQEAEDFWEKIK